MSQTWTATQIPYSTGKTAIVTGANSGIGFEAARELARKGAQVVMACRKRDKGEAARQRIRDEQPDAQVEWRALDLANQASVREFAAEFGRRGTPLDLLINNAGVMAIPFRKTVDGFEMQLGTNHFGHFALTGLLLDALLAAPAARVVTVSSGAHLMGSMNFADLNWEQGYQPWWAYGRSKLANLLFAYELQRKFAAAEVRAISVAAHPGYAATNLQFVGPEMAHSSFGVQMSRIGNALLAQTAAMGALPTLYAAVAPDVQGGDYIGPGGLFGMRGYPAQAHSNAASHDTAAAAKLWAVSVEKTRVRYDALAAVPV